MIRTKVIQKGASPKQIIYNSVKMDLEFKARVDALGQRALNYMLETINENLVRPSPLGESNLLNNIKIEYFDNGWGIGNISDLKSKAPYFLALNYGSSAAVGKRVPPGHFSPGDPAPNKSEFRAGRFYPGQADGEGKTYSFIVEKPIQPIDYIEKTANWLDSEIDKLINTWSK